MIEVYQYTSKNIDEDRQFLFLIKDNISQITISIRGDIRVRDNMVLSRNTSGVILKSM
jgi:hypothetical protein